MGPSDPAPQFSTYGLVILPSPFNVAVGFNNREWCEWEARLIVTEPPTVRSVQASLANDYPVALSVYGANFLSIQNAISCDLGNGQASVGKFFSDNTIIRVFPLLKNKCRFVSSCCALSLQTAVCDARLSSGPLLKPRLCSENLFACLVHEVHIRDFQ